MGRRATSRAFRTGRGFFLVRYRAVRLDLVVSPPSRQRSVLPPRIEYLGVLRPACVRTPRTQ
eukprot:4249196-Prymnesium_polylepis.1